MKNPPESTNSARKWGCLGFALFVCVVLAGLVLGLVGISSSIRTPRQNAALQSARTIGFALFRYASDHAGSYPPGETSTAVFQHLIDEHYLKDASVFYVRMPGKSVAQGNQLQPENVSWDFTFCANPMASDEEPLIFLTGYKVDYRANSRAVPLIPPAERTWTQWWDNQGILVPYMAVYYKNNSVKVLKVDGDGSVPHFISARFNPGKSAFLQLTPDSSLIKTTSS